MPATIGVENEEEPILEEEVLGAQHQTSAARSTPTTEGAEDDDDVPLGNLLNMNRNASLNRVATTDVARATRSTPNLLARPTVDQIPVRTVNEEVRGSAPQPTQPSSMSGPEEPSLGVRARNSHGKKRIMSADERAQRNPKRPNQIVHPFMIGASNSTRNVGQSSVGGRHSGPNMDGTTDTLRLTKHLVQTQGEEGIDTEVRNLNSEVEREVQFVSAPREDDENESPVDNSSADESHEVTDPEADEVSSDDTFAP